MLKTQSLQPKQLLTGHSTTLLSYNQNTRDAFDKEVQFVNTNIEDARDALQLENLEYADFQKKIKEYCGIIMPKDKTLNSNWTNKALS